MHCTDKWVAEEDGESGIKVHRHLVSDTLVHRLRVIEDHIWPRPSKASSPNEELRPRAMSKEKAN